MAKYKAKKKKSDTVAPQIRPGLPCLIIVVGAIIVVSIIMILVMRNG